MRKLTQEEFIKRAKLIHKNNYDYSLIDYKTLVSKVKIKCNKCNKIFKQSPTHHLRGHGCNKCNTTKVLTTKIFIDRSNKIHEYKYDYGLVNYVNGSTNVKILCKKHNIIFEQIPESHLVGKSGCKMCFKENQSNKFRLNIKEVVKKFKIVHGNKYNYKLINYINNHTKVKIVCKKHNYIFEQTPINHFVGKGCPICNYSKGELKIKSILEKNNIEFFPQKKFDGCKHKQLLPFDFYLPKYNCCIEYYGIQHYKGMWTFKDDKVKLKASLKSIQKSDRIKTNYCRNNNIKLIRIKYTKYDIIDKILTELFI